MDKMKNMAEAKILEIWEHVIEYFKRDRLPRKICINLVNITHVDDTFDVDRPSLR